MLQRRAKRLLSAATTRVPQGAGGEEEGAAGAGAGAGAEEDRPDPTSAAGLLVPLPSVAAALQVGGWAGRDGVADGGGTEGLCVWWWWGGLGT